MIIKSIYLENMRCFERKKFEIQSNFVVIQGNNGVGKTTLLEALHYVCYLRSFRTRTVRDFIAEGAQHAFLEVDFYQMRYKLDEKISVGIQMDAKKNIRLNDKQVQSYKDLIDHYRVVTLTADDLALVSGEPSERRYFMNAATLLIEPTSIQLFKEFNRFLDLRNAYLEQQRKHGAMPSDEFKVWTQLFWKTSYQIQNIRKKYLATLESSLTHLISKGFPNDDLRVQVAYISKEQLDYNFENFWQHYISSHYSREVQYGRSLFGIHLDDFVIFLNGKKARHFASRGQQKLLAYLIKIVQVQEFAKSGNPVVFLVDDFLTDFDKDRAIACLDIIRHLSAQVILTIPLEYASLFSPENVQVIAL